MEHDLLQAGVVGIIVIVIYVLWNVMVNLAAARSEGKVKRLEYERAKNAAKATFISNMSHDIRTPLNGIVGMLQVIRNHREEKAVVDECLEKIGISAQYLSTLANDMLDIDEIEKDKLVLAQEPVNLEKLAYELTVLMEKQAKDVGVDYAMDLSQLTVPNIIGSSVHIKRILVNLVSNAIKYSKNAGRNVWVTISDEAMAGDPDRRMYRFVIRDNGIGMSEEFQTNMYGAFEQEQIDARSEYQGYGLGLTIVKHLTKKMGGTIVLDSTKGVGSVFTVSIPFRTDTAVEETEVVLPCDLTGFRILLVEDNEFNMEIASTLLTDAGAQVDEATNGRRAVEVFASSEMDTYDAIIMDVMMPEMDGCEATKVIRGMDRPDGKTVPIVAMTASTFSEDVERCRAAGMDAHLAKPFQIEETIAALHTLRQRGR